MRGRIELAGFILALAASTPAFAQPPPWLTAQDRAREDARRIPAPDVSGMLIVLLQSFNDKPVAVAGPGTHWYVTVVNADGRQGDPPPGVLAAIRTQGTELLAGSKTPALDATSARLGRDVRWRIDSPLRRADGNYDVNFSYYCGSTCAGGLIAVMSHDSQGWHVLSQQALWYS